MKFWSVLTLIFISIGCASQQGSLSSSPGSSAHRFEDNPRWLVEANSPHQSKVDCNLTGFKSGCTLTTVQKHSPMTVKPMNSRNLKKITVNKGPLVQTVGKDFDEDDLPTQAKLQSIHSLAMAPSHLPENEGGHFPEIGGEQFAEIPLTEEDIEEDIEAEVQPVAPAKAIERPVTQPVMQTAKVEPIIPPAAEEPLAVDPDLLTPEASPSASEPAKTESKVDEGGNKEGEQPTQVQVNPGDTLIEIARRFHPEETTRAAVALWMENKDHFIDGNMNGLQVGKILTLSNLDSRMARLDTPTARRTLKEQWQQWTARNKPPEAEQNTPESETPKTAELAPQANEEKSENPEEAQQAKSTAPLSDPKITETAKSDDEPATSEAADAPEEETSEPLPSAENTAPSVETPTMTAKQEDTADTQTASVQLTETQEAAGKPVNKLQKTLGNLQNKVTNVAQHLWGQGFQNFVSRVRGNPLLNKEP